MRRLLTLVVLIAGALVAETGVSVGAAWHAESKHPTTHKTFNHFTMDSRAV